MNRADKRQVEPLPHSVLADHPSSHSCREMHRVQPELVSFRTDPHLLPDEADTEASLFDLVEPIAKRALLLGLTAEEKSFHVFVAADHGVRIEEDIVRFAREVTERKVAAKDIVYVHDFDRPFAPKPLFLPAGKARLFSSLVDELMDQLQAEMPSIVDTDKMLNARAELAQKLEHKHREVLTGLESTAKHFGFGVRGAQGSLQTFPILHGKPLSSEQFSVLDEPTKKALVEAESKLATEVEKAARLVRAETLKFQAKRDEVLTELASQHISAAVTKLIQKLGNDFGGDVLIYIEKMRQALARDWQDLVTLESDPSEEREEESSPSPRDHDPEHATRLSRFKVNVFVSHEGSNDSPLGTPVIYETNPTYTNLFGYLERRAILGALLTDFTRIRAGAMHRASGGVLILRAADLMADPIIWERLKRVLRERQMTTEDPTGPLGIYATTLRPVPVPLELKVVLIGSHGLYTALLDADPDFAALFRIKVEIEASSPRTEMSLKKLDGILMKAAKERSWGTFGKGARAKLLDLASRLAGERERISIYMDPLEETAAFSGTFALKKNGGEQMIHAEHIQFAWAERRERMGAAERQFREMILSGEIAIDTQGLRVGCINGLSVLSTGDVEFGQPMRITAVVALGREGLIDVEREAQLGGAIHTKGIAILRGFLGRMFGQERPISLRAQIAFEQSYGEVDGDSASAAELFALLSALADVAIDQSIAVTGSINQLGAVQTVGGVCAKIEGFYDLCLAKGLTGHQGVMIPKSNLTDLVLRDDVVDAIEKGQFHLFSIEHIAHGMEILTGLLAGERDNAGRFPASSIFGRVERRMIEMAERLKLAEAPQRLTQTATSVEDMSRSDLGDEGVDFLELGFRKKK